MRILILIVNYTFLFIWIFLVYYLFLEFDKNLMIMTAMFFLTTFVNLIYVYKSIPYDKEKERLKKQVEDLNKKIEKQNQENKDILDDENIENK